MQTEQFQLHAEIEDRHWWFVARRQILRRLVDRLLLKPNAPGPSQSGSSASAPLVIDVGCGTGANLAALADAYRCLGIDTSADAVSLASQRFPGIEFRQGLAPDDLADQIGQASLVMLMDVLEHVPDDFSLFSRLLGAMAPGAHLLLTVPADRTLWSPHDVSFGHYRRYDRARLAMLWEGLPVRVRLVSYYNTRLYPLIKAARMVGRWRGRALGAAGTDFALPPGFLNRQLTRTMSAESGRLLRVLAGESPEYRRGVSLVAVVRREAGVVPHLFKPASAGPDLYCPGQPEAPLAMAT